MKTTGEKNLFSGSLYLVSFTGVMYGLLKYFYQIETQYGLRPHDSQGFWQHVHILASPISIFFIGYFWSSHIYPKMKTTVQVYKRTGWTMLISLFPMILSGFAIQISVSASTREIWAWLHIFSSSLFFLTFILHQIRARLATN